MKRPSLPPETTAVPDPLRDRHVVLCVTGGIAAYKSAYLTRLLVQSGAQVIVVMSHAAQRFVAPLTFETLSGNPVVTSSFERAHAMGAVEHVDLAEWASVVIVAPATYNILGKLQAGIADDPVTTFLSAVRAPVFLAPSMNDFMWQNPINQRNVQTLRELGYSFIDPEHGELACIWEGEGRMREPDAIVDAVRTALSRSGQAPPGSSVTPGGAKERRPGAPERVSRSPLAGRTVLISAGGTRESIDPVRYIGNRSSGKTGHALAATAAERGARVLLVSGPSSVTPPGGLAGVRHVESAGEMLEALQTWLPQSDVLIMAAAVADYRPGQVFEDKIKKSSAPLHLELEPADDILTALLPGKGARLFVGFSLETGDPEAEARAKLARKGLDLVVANRVGPQTGPDVDTNRVWVYDNQGLVLETPLVSKEQVAEAILAAIESELGPRSAHAGV